MRRAPVIDNATEPLAEPTAKWLHSAGWWQCDDGWRHRSLIAPWPTGDAIRLQREADDGGQDPVHRGLRGEA